MADEEVTCTPIPHFDPMTGYLRLLGEGVAEIVCRFDGKSLHVWFKKGRREVPLSIDFIEECHRRAKQTE